MTIHLLRAAGLVLVLLLAGCSSMGGIAPSSGGSAGAPRALDFVGDNLSDLVFALDLPDGVQPTQAGISLTYDVNDPTAPAFIETSLVHADAEAVMGVLPPPQAGRNYHVFAMANAAREKTRTLQAFARGLQKPPAPLLNIVPRLCSMGTVDKTRTTYTLRVVLPGRGPINPLISNETLAALEARSAMIGLCR